MEKQPKWQYDEMKHCGVDYSNQAQVEVYDKRHQRFRDYEKEGQSIIDRLGLGADDTVIDIGCGTGAFTLWAAKFCKKVYAIDVSMAMLDYCKQKAKKGGLNNIEFYHGGFLTYEHGDEPADAIVSQVALHHLPDFWKLIGLQRLAKMLKAGGKLYLRDQVYSFKPAEYRDHFDCWVRKVEEGSGEGFAGEIIQSIREEYMTIDWIMEEIIVRAGFEIDKADYYSVYGASYLCTKKDYKEI